jgi:D-sedoheptulose 7-phosphate isomerase|tara:strand:+ start:8169 stop:8744 length:576 start_codon:yes stop_codon:yes gene_type:complete
MKDKIFKIFNESAENISNVSKDHCLIASMEKVVALSSEAFNNNQRILFCGNGGSAADAQHIAAELSGRFLKERKALFAEALHVNSSYLTAVANDYGFEYTYSRILEATGRKGDVLIGLSTSGNSLNVINALKKAKEIGMKTIGFTGKDGGKMCDVCDIVFNIPSSNTARIQEAHILLGHTLCQLIEEKLFD